MNSQDYILYTYYVYMHKYYFKTVVIIWIRSPNILMYSTLVTPTLICWKSTLETNNACMITGIQRFSMHISKYWMSVLYMFVISPWFNFCYVSLFTSCVSLIEIRTLCLLQLIVSLFILQPWVDKKEKKNICVKVCMPHSL